MRVGGPFHRAAHLLGGPHAHRLLGVDEDLGAEAAADVRGDHPQLVLGGDADEGGEHQPRHMRVLAGGVEGVVLAALVVVAHRRARLHRIGNQAVVDEVERGDMGGAGEGGVGRRLVPEMPLEHRVLRRDLMHLRGARLARVPGHGDRRQHVVVDDDGLRRILGGGESVGDDHRHMVAHVAHLALREGRMRPRLHRRAVLGMDHPAADQPADLVGGQILAGEDRHHPRHGRRGGLVDAVDRGMGVRRAEEVGVGLARTVDVVGVAALADEVAAVLAPLHGRADPGDLVVHGFLRNTLDRAARRPAVGRPVSAAACSTGTVYRLIRLPGPGLRPSSPCHRPPPP